MENFTIFPNTYKERDNQPDYVVSVRKEGDDEGYEKWGACWKKKGTKGTYLSCSKSKPMEQPKTPEVTAEDEGINPSDIPF